MSFTGLAAISLSNVSVDEVRKKHVSLLHTTKNLTARAKLVTYFQVESKDCTATSDLEIRAEGNVINILQTQTGFTGYTPTYTTADGTRHKGVYSGHKKIYFSDGSSRVLLTVYADKLTEIDTGRVEVDSVESPDLLREGRSLDPEMSPDQVFTGTRGGLEVATFTKGESQIEFTIDPKKDFLVVKKACSRNGSKIWETRMESFQQVSKIWFPKLVVNETYSPDGTTSFRNEYTYTDIETSNGGSRLWFKELPEGVNLVGPGSSVYVVDKSGEPQRLGNKDQFAHAPSSYNLVQIVSLTVLLCAITILVVKRIRTR